MIKDLARKIVNLKVNCNDASRLRGRDPVFHSASEIERLIVKLPLFLCRTQDDFKEFVDVIHKFIIESSGNGQRLPEDPRIDSMKSCIKELRNHFYHIREFGKPAEVRRKYRKVGKIYQTLIGRDVPKEEDWRELQIAMLQMIVRGLQRAQELLVAEEPLEILETFEDNRIFIFGKQPVKSRSTLKRGFLSAFAEIPVFMPEFTWVPPPQLGSTKSAVYVTSRPPIRGRINEFQKFAHEIEQKWRETQYLRSTYGPFYWTISKGNHFAYGCGGKNLIEELRKYNIGAVGAVLGNTMIELASLCFMHIKRDA